MKKLVKNHQLPKTSLTLFLFFSLLIVITFSCGKENNTVPVQTTTASLQESDLVQDARSNNMVNTAALGLLKLSKNAQFRALVHSKCQDQFDGDYNVLLKDLKTSATSIGVDLENSFRQSILENAAGINAADFKPPYGYFSDAENIGKSISGYNYFDTNFYLQVYVPNFEENSVENKQPIIVLYPDDNETCSAHAYVLQEDGTFKTVIADESFVKNNLLWVVSINENTDSNGAVLSAKIDGTQKVQVPFVDSKGKEASMRSPDTKNAFISEIQINSRNECLFGGRADVYIYAAHFVDCFTVSTLGTPDPSISPDYGLVNRVENCIGKFGRFKLNEWHSVTGLASYLATNTGAYINALEQTEGLAFFIYERDVVKKKNKKIWKCCGVGFEREYYSKDNLYHDEKFNYSDCPNYNPNNAGQWEDFDVNDIQGDNSLLRLKGRIFRF